MYINLQANRRDVVNNVDGRIKRKEKKTYERIERKEMIAIANCHVYRS